MHETSTKKPKKRFSYEEVSELEVKQIEPEEETLEMIALDDEKEYEHDDAFAYEKEEDNWYKVSTTMSPISASTEWETKHLPHTNRFSLPKKRKRSYNLRGNRLFEAIVVSYHTNGEEIAEPTIGLHLIRPVAIAHRNLERSIQRDLLKMTGLTYRRGRPYAKQTPHAIERLMITHNIFMTNFLTGQAPLVYYNHVETPSGNTHPIYSTEPLGFSTFNIPAYARFTSPMRRDEDRGLGVQAFEHMRGHKSVRNERSMRGFSTYLNETSIIKSARNRLLYIDGWELVADDLDEVYKARKMNHQNGQRALKKRFSLSKAQASSLLDLPREFVQAIPYADFTEQRERMNERIELIEETQETGSIPSKYLIAA